MAELEAFLAAHGHLRDVVVQGVDLARAEVDWHQVEVARAVFIACPMPEPVTHALLRSGAVVIPDLRDDRPYSVYPSGLYTPEALIEGGRDELIRIWFEHSLAGGPEPAGPVEAIAQRLHDAAMTDAIFDLIRPEDGEPRRVVGIMGGHAVTRDSDEYAAVVRLAYGLTGAGCLVATGGGPGVMEAGNLGAYLTRAGSAAAIEEALATLAPASSVEHPGYGEAAERVHSTLAGRAGGESLAVPTWLYGHEPIGRFATHVAKYFANSIREDGLLRMSVEGVVFARGGPGTVQEIFQDAAINAYARPAERAPMVFLGRDFFTSNGIWDVMRSQAAGAKPPYDELLTLTDDVDEAIAAIGSPRP